MIWQMCSCNIYTILDQFDHCVTDKSETEFLQICILGFAFWAHKLIVGDSWWDVFDILV